jgi:Clp amino terminal domain, pathogenicity island component
MPPPSPLSLQDAIHWVDDRAADSGALTRLHTASTLVQDLADVGDATLGFYVDQARHAGHSWSEIGDALGVTKQAAQQKHTVRLSLGPNQPTFEHLTPRARKVVGATQEIAQNLGHGYVGTEHLLLALYREPESVAAQILVDADIPQERVEAEVADRVPRGTETVEHPPFTPRAVAVCTGALSSALELGHNYIGTEHLLLGLARGDGVAANVLRDCGLTQDALAKAVTDRLAHYADVLSAASPPKKRARPKSSAPRKRAPAKKSGRR